MASANLDIRIEAKDAFSATFNSLHNSLGQVNTATKATSAGFSGLFGGLVEGLGKIGLAADGIKAIAGAAQGAGNAIGIGLVSEMEQTTAKFVAFTGSSEEAARLLKVVRAEADATPFSFKELANATASLLPASKQSGVALMDLTKVAETLGALNPAQGLEGAAIALRAAVGGDFTSIIERFDLPRERMNELKKQGVPAVEAVTLALKELGIDGGLVAGMANTLSGRWSTFQDTIDGFKTSIAQPIFNQLKIGLENVGGLISENREYFDDWANSIGAAIGEVGQEFNTFLVTVGNIKNVEGVDTFTAVITALELRIGEVFGPGAQSLFHSFVDVISILGATGKRVFDALNILFVKVLADFGGGMDTATLRQNAFKDAMDNFASVVEEAGKLFLQFANWVTGSAPGAEAFRVIVVGLGAAFVAYQTYVTIAAAATQTMAVLQGVLNAVMSANPIGIIVLALVALTAGLVYAYKNSETFRNIVDSTWEVLKGAVATTITFVVDTFNTFVTYMAALPARITAFAIAIGTGIVDGIVGGINSFTAKVRGTVEDLANSLPGWVKKILGIASPSTVFAEIGMDIVDGLAQGIDENTGIAETAMVDLAAAIGATVPVVLSASEQATGKMMASIEGAQKDHHKRVLDAEADHNVKIADLTADLAAAKPAQRKAILDRIADEETSYQRKTEGLAVDHEDRLTEIRQRGAEDQLAIAERQNATNYQAAQDLMSGLATIEASTASALDGVGERTGTRINEAIQAAASAIAEVSQRATDQIASASGNLDASRELRGRRAEFGAGQTAQADERKAAQEASDLIDKRAREDADRAVKMSADLAKAKTDVERKAVADRFEVATSDLTARRNAEDADTIRKRARAEDDRRFRQSQAIALQSFNDGIDNENLTKQITRIGVERDARITGINDALVEKQAQIAADAKLELEKIGASADERIAALKAKFFDKVGPLTDGARASIDTYIQGVQGRIGALHAAAVAAAAAVASVGGGGGDNGVSSVLADALTSVAGGVVQTIDDAGNEIARGRQRMGGQVFAAGGRSVPGGMSLVGERGPELVRMPGGADVFSASDTGRMLSGGGNDNRPIIIQLDGQVIARTTWSYLKRQNLVGSNLGFA